MVTNLDTHQQLVTTRAPSVTSRASSSRRHRQSRSHTGTSSSTSTQNGFPFFAVTGDVEISLASVNGRKEKQYLLHRLILSQGSGYFENELKEDPGRFPTSGGQIHQPRPVHPSHTLVENDPLDSRAIGALARRSSTESSRQRWRFVLDWGNTVDVDVPWLVRRPPTFTENAGPPPVSRNKPPTSSNAFFRSMANRSALNISSSSTPAPDDPDDEMLRDYDNLFRIFYNYSPALDSVNIANAYTECKALLHLAEMYDALPVVGPRIDYHLLRFGNRLFKQIAKYPPSYLKLGYLARSKVIFTEALIHVVGQWPQARPHLEGHADHAILDLIEDKVDVLAETKAKVESKLFRLTLTTSRGEPVSPATSFLDWLAVSLFRQWLAEQTSPPQGVSPAPVKDGVSPRPSSGPISRPGSSGIQPRANRASLNTQQSASRSLIPTSQSHNSTSSRQIQPISPVPPYSSGKVYRLLGSPSTAAYLGREELKRFLKNAPEGLYTRDNVRRLERKMDDIKTLARDIVKPLIKNNLELDLVAAGLATPVLRDGETDNRSRDIAGLGYLTCTRVMEGDYPWDD